MIPIIFQIYLLTSNKAYNSLKAHITTFKKYLKYIFFFIFVQNTIILIKMTWEQKNQTRKINYLLIWFYTQLKRRFNACTIVIMPQKLFANNN